MEDVIQAEVNALPPEPRRRLERAAGFTEAGLTALARRELERVPAEHRDLVCVRALRLDLDQREHRWAEACAEAERLAAAFPGVAHLRIAHAYAARRARSLAEAEEILLRMTRDFPGQGLPHYNLACYAAARGDLDLARSRLREAIEFSDGYLAMAMDDEDLAGLGDWLIELEERRWPGK